MWWLKWRAGLVVGKALKFAGGKLLDAGWGIMNRSARLYDKHNR